MVGATGFEPVTTRTPSVCATRLRYAPTSRLEIVVTLTLQLGQINLSSRLPASASLRGNKLKKIVEPVRRERQ
jgi:hypothetical protein